ncbi:putative unusual protein kinase [Halovivax ruber XH-70]|uniref:Putative unusual protein kinase n=1 Tax=Halovivax ruber (strain DSM 18193 / JCM 13892 / XH-70) TaxID=797302 RepID=L0IFS1_HALRX|nr:AarF/ABC1/UbiB kinase family protein [Halovivax ruber]AGB16792.1 putative unusual protein kinase [Halovivax ruber XH-70]
MRRFLPLLLAYARDRHRFVLFGRSRTVSRAVHRERAERLLSILFALGPTFVKLGQLLSSRPDVLPPTYLEVLSALQDDVPPADWDDARTVLEDELGPVDERFDDFDREAISGASLGQVYRASLDEEDVAVKVRRPGVESLVAADLRVIHWTVPLLRRFVDDARAYSLDTLADEFDRTIRQEMDYEREARMLEAVAANFTDDAGVVHPDVIESHSGKSVLTMEYVEGTKITDVETLDAMDVDRAALAERLQEAYMQMVIEDGVFHADPHPGNLAVDDEGRIVFYDFGMSGRVDPYIQDKIVDFYVAIARRDTDAVLDALIEVGTLRPDADRAVMAEVLELAIEDATGAEIEQRRVQRIVDQIEDSIYEFPFRLPRNLALVLRVATVVEGVCVTLDPEFDFIETATHFLTERGYREETARAYVEDAGNQLRQSVISAARIPPKAERALDRVERDDLFVRAGIEDPDDVLDQLARRITYGLVLAAGIVTAGLGIALDATAVALTAGALIVVATIALRRSFRTREGISARPQFTRQRLRQREPEQDEE